MWCIKMIPTLQEELEIELTQQDLTEMSLRRYKELISSLNLVNNYLCRISKTLEGIQSVIVTETYTDNDGLISKSIKKLRGITK